MIPTSHVRPNVSASQRMGFLLFAAFSVSLLIGSASTAQDATEKPKAAAFQDQFQEWKEILVDLRTIRAKFQTAEDSELEGLRSEWAEKIEAGQTMESPLQAAAIEAFAESPNEDRELSRFLVTVISDKIRKDDYNSANDLASALVAAGCNEREMSDLAGIAAYGTNNFDVAAKLLNEAKENGSISNQAMTYLESLEEVKSGWEREAKLRAAEAEADDLPRVKLTTDAGEVVLELFENEAPETVGNFISLIEKGFYDNLTFHRVMEAFMAQGGCPNGDGSGGPGYNIYCECTGDNHRHHFAGSLSMAKQQARNTGGSQFFINYLPTPHLNGQHTVFGRVIEGQDVAANFKRIEPGKEGQPTTIVKAEVLRKREHEYKPNKVK